VRGIKVCEALSSHYDLHMLNRSDDAPQQHHRRLQHRQEPLAAQPPPA